MQMLGEEMYGQWLKNLFRTQLDTHGFCQLNIITADIKRQIGLKHLSQLNIKQLNKPCKSRQRVIYKPLYSLVVYIKGIICAWTQSTTLVQRHNFLDSLHKKLQADIKVTTDIKNAELYHFLHIIKRNSKVFQTFERIFDLAPHFTTV